MVNQIFLVENNQVVVNLVGSLQGELAAQVRETMLTYISDGYCEFKVDFSNVNSINSTGLGMLVNIQKRAIQSGGDVVIQGLNGAVKAAFDRTRLSKAFIILDTTETAA